MDLTDIDIDQMMAGKGTDWKPLNEDTWEQELDQIPLFMKSLPSAEDAANNESLQAIQSLVYDGTPVEIATNFKNQGNEIVQARQKQHYQHAIQYYARALEQNCGDDTVDCACFLNRARVHLELGNHRSTITDCQRALKLMDTSNQANQLEHLRVKAWFRFTKALLMLDKFTEAQKCINGALKQLKADEKDVIEPLMQLYRERKEKYEAEQARRVADKQRKLLAEEELMQCFKLRNIPDPVMVADTPSTSLFPRPQADQALNDKPCVMDKYLAWPILVVYPELETFDYIQQWHEDASLKELLQEVFHNRTEWSKQYLSDQVALYVPITTPKGKMDWQRVQILSGLRGLYRLKGYQVPEDGILRLWVLPRLDTKAGLEFTKPWLKDSLPKQE